jgi:CobQ-like glutamine amidotransferase family enzyme
MKLVVGHLYPDYLNIYADRGNIAVLSRRAACSQYGRTYPRSATIRRNRSMAV